MMKRLANPWNIVGGRCAGYGVCPASADIEHCLAAAEMGETPVSVILALGVRWPRDKSATWDDARLAVRVAARRMPSRRRRAS